jgi:superfamily II DNA or RNA helicase
VGLFRDRLAARLREDLVGPLSVNEVLADRPTRRYSTGILYPQDSRIEQEENQDDGGLAVNEREDAASSPDESGVSLHAALKPATAGMSFAVEPAFDNTPPVLTLETTCATYEPFAVDHDGKKVEGQAPDREHERWQRHPHHLTTTVPLSPGEHRVRFDEQGVTGLELYVLVKAYAGLLTVTAALSNLRERGDSRVYDEQQHVFQVEVTATSISKGEFAPRPSRRARTDEDSQTAALIYRDVKEHVVGHTCSARAVLNEDGSVACLKTDWVPSVVVPSVSDRGDKVFDTLRDGSGPNPLEAAWLAEAPRDELVDGLERLVAAYCKWVEREQKRIPDLRDDLQAQAERHLERCREGAARMRQSITLLRSAEGSDALAAFQLAQGAMRIQFGWSRDGEELTWRPFQLAFQLLVLTSLADRSHPDREVMDLLWFPTGGGKTEAYLGLTAFTIFLRRLRGSEADDGAGVAVLMRYTLRLLTVQQFQRAAALIFACELLRKAGVKGKADASALGSAPIGIGLWVGESATPLTLKDACDRSSDDFSTPVQLTTCPACGEALQWSITPKASTVTCPSPPTECDLAAAVPQFPVWTIDEEVYRHTPSLLIGTVDKFAQVVRKLDTRVLFGKEARRSPPDLIIQDELHLISGPLGSIAGLYEVAIDELCRSKQGRVKIVGSTATIRRAEEQIRALFDRGTYQFPAPGLDAGNSGFAVMDPSKPARRYVGLTTAGRSATYMLQALAASLLQAATEPGATDEERNYYWTLLTYFNSLRELGRALVLMQDDVPVSIMQFAARRGEEPRKTEAPAELTSRVRSYEIRDMLDRLKKLPGDPEAVDLLLASNMISVGMDIPRLGLMLVNAQPKSLSEYIQATSRVGRGSVPGLIVTMYNSMRARDRSHYETFETWHQSLYRDVEATSVTPFASRAQDKALHAVLVALARHTVKGLDTSPVLDERRRRKVEAIAARIEQRVAAVDPSEQVAVAQKLTRLIDQWASRPDLQRYWDDYGNRTTLMMSAEQYAAQASRAEDLDGDGARRALWPTPNSMREVEAGTPFVLRNVLRTEER